MLALLERDRAIVLSGVVGLTALAWLTLWRHAGGMDMDAAMSRFMPWRLTDLTAAVPMWGAMMIAMMLPSAAPMLLLFSSVQRKRLSEVEAAKRTGFFAGGYLLIWLAWSGLAAGFQWAVQSRLLLSPHLSPHLTPTSVLLSGAFLLLAGLYEFTSWKNACLIQCQSPLGFLLTRWREGPWGAFRMGLRHGAYCLGCCWALMGLLFVGGVMNLLWMAVLAGFVLLEKAVARGPRLSRVAGVVLIGWGLYLLGSGFTS